MKMLLHLTGVTFSLTGYDSIPTNGSGRVLITNINPNGDNNEDALICLSEIPIFENTTVGDWYLHPTEMSTDENDRIYTLRVSKSYLLLCSSDIMSIKMA